MLRPDRMFGLLERQGPKTWLRNASPRRKCLRSRAGVIPAVCKIDAMSVGQRSKGVFIIAESGEAITHPCVITIVIRFAEGQLLAETATNVEPS